LIERHNIFFHIILNLLVIVLHKGQGSFHPN